MDEKIDLNYFGTETTLSGSNDNAYTTLNNWALYTLCNIELADIFWLNTIEYTKNTDEAYILNTNNSYWYYTQNSRYKFTIKPRGKPYVSHHRSVTFAYHKVQLVILIDHAFCTTMKKDKLPTRKELTSSLYNAHKQRIFRQKNNNSLGLTKTNQKKLVNYAKEQNITEKKALNEIVKTMLD